MLAGKGVVRLPRGTGPAGRVMMYCTRWIRSEMKIIGGVLLRFRLQSLLLSLVCGVSGFEEIVIADFRAGLEFSMRGVSRAIICIGFYPWFDRFVGL
jgi:hypothetical protein